MTHFKLRLRLSHLQQRRKFSTLPSRNKQLMKRYRVLLVAFQKKKLIFCHHPNKKFGTSCFIRASQNCRHIHLSTFKKKQKNKKRILKLTTKFPRALFIDTLWFHKILYFLQSPPLDSVQNFNFWLHIQTNVPFF